MGYHWIFQQWSDMLTNRKCKYKNQKYCFKIFCVCLLCVAKKWNIGSVGWRMSTARRSKHIWCCLLADLVWWMCLKVTDETYLQKLDKHCIGHPHYESRGCKEFLSDQTLKQSNFRLVHYAGKVPSIALRL